MLACHVWGVGTYSIIIEGHGISHNGTPKDADEMGKGFVAALRASGHTEVKGYFVYGPKLATPLEATMTRGIGSKKLEPLAPLCDHREWVSDKHGRYSVDCKNEAAQAILPVGVSDIVSVRCDDHRRPPNQNEVEDILRPAVMG